jgi:gluconate 5-dehydrogenase
MGRAAAHQHFKRVPCRPGGGSTHDPAPSGQADWAKYGLQINAIAPGYFKTPLNQALVDDPEFSAWLAKRTPAGRWGNVDELVGAAVFLAGPASSFVNGHTLYVDGGISTAL